MTSTVVQDLIAKTFRELSQPTKPIQRSRISTTPNGYTRLPAPERSDGGQVHLVAWSNASLLRLFIRRFTETLSKSEYRLKAQTDDAARSVVANIEEGFARPTTNEYLTFLGYSQASLIEVKGDIQRSSQDGLLPSIPGSSIAGLGIDLKPWHEALKNSVISRPKGVYRNLEEPKGKNQEPQHIYTAVAEPHTIQTPLKSFTFLYSPVDNLRASQLTYEVFIELINKTDWHLRRLVESLEDKLNRDQKFYQVERARIRSNVKMR
ncbi:MAG: hypothetical protein UY16_C0021G0012 [Candidatus Gottesmanbacteria bacterium GW2011_GWA2_47_9]|uniref:S23 ribosomal protein n=1 Tax=Candidatus Gottesmanbacteria bacterium GW2011_GWA2_47_9 TaxID=1618445 RepID=A0A0G1U0Q3_9BACT|nr:MAG: hypothetical protein UY16_C0021G0012 [Candidatus Gottesmanbacteria bacterium GW2011_GWA2_47_9]